MSKTRRDFIRKLGLTSIGLPLIGKTIQASVSNKENYKTLSFKAEESRLEGEIKSVNL